MRDLRSWSDVTIKQYILSSDIINNKELDPLEREIELLCLFSGKTLPEVDQMTAEDFNKAIRSLAFLSDFNIKEKVKKDFIINGQSFQFNLLINKHLTGQYVDYNYFLKGTYEDAVKNMHNLLAVVAQPVVKGKVLPYDGTKHSEVAKLFYDYLTMDIAYPVFVFFCQVWRNLTPYIQTFLESEAKKMMKTLHKNEAILNSDMVG